MLRPAARAQVGYAPSGCIPPFACAQPSGRFLFEEVCHVASRPTLCACLHSTLDTPTLCYIFIYPRFACNTARRIVEGVSRRISIWICKIR
jgi:hypothetical protein